MENKKPKSSNLIWAISSIVAIGLTVNHIFTPQSSLMKRLLFLLIITAAATKLNAQVLRMELKHNGFVSSTDSTKNYIVLNHPKVSKTELYKKTLTYLNSIYKNPKQVISSVENESIAVNAYSDEITATKGLYRYPFDYNIVLQFKDGKIKFEPHVIEISEIFTVSKSKNRFYVANTDSPEPVEIRCIYMRYKDKPGYFLFQDEIKTGFDQWLTSYLAGLEKAINDTW
ncbi:DUF4468 domain-containing protein [Pedobacter zeae]|nr:DUF4468 domain-containing protein [Pedobacter zeae]MBB4108331.1 hypothetical protein [Pedobacter zeae]